MAGEILRHDQLDRRRREAEHEHQQRDGGRSAPPELRHLVQLHVRRQQDEQQRAEREARQRAVGAACGSR